MKAALLHAPGDMRIDEVPTPVPGPGDLLVRVEACGICPSDIRIFRTGRTDLLQLPVTLGHETVGVVTAVGTASDEHLVGSRVFVDGYGGFAEYTLDRNTGLAGRGGPFVLPATLRAEDAVFVEPLADCLFAVDHCADARHATSALVSGCGQMGLQIVRLCVLRGLRVVAVDPVARRRDLALSFGAELAVSSDDDVLEAAEAISGGAGVDTAIVAAPDPDALVPALEALAPGGACVLFSASTGGPLSIPAHLIHERRLRISGSRWVIGRKQPHWALYRQAIGLLSAGFLDLGQLVERRVPFTGLAEGFDAMSSGTAMKALFVP